MGQALEVTVLDSHLTGRPEVGHVVLPLSRIPKDGTMTAWLPLQVCSPLLHLLPLVHSACAKWCSCCWRIRQVGSCWVEHFFSTLQSSQRQ